MNFDIYQLLCKKETLDVHGSVHHNTGCPTPYGTRYFFNNYNTNQDIATKFEQQYVRFVRNVMTS
jgi:hypothetical protein